MSVRPRLKNHVRPLRRSATAVQFGLVPDSGLVVEGLGEHEIVLLQQLDGSLDATQLYAVAHQHGVSTTRLDQLLGELRRHRLLVDDPTDRADLSALADLEAEAQRRNADGLALAYRLAGDGWRPLARRRSQFVLVGGSGGLPEAVADLLRGGGIGRVETGSTSFDATAQALTMTAVHRQDAAADVDGVDGGHGRAPSGGPADDISPAVLRDAPDVVVLPATCALPPGAGAPWWRCGIPHLPLVTQGHQVVLGPLVVPGQGPCLDCLDLHRRDRDPAWPALLTQLAPLPGPGPGLPVEAESTLTATAAGLVAMVVHGHLDGLRLPMGVSLELSLPWPWLTHRQWAPHPACDCAG